MNNNSTSLYIHIPYCRNICSYCDFCKKNYNFSECLIYILDLVKDIENLNKKYKTIYVGGGTPSCIDDFLLEILLKSLSKHLDDDYEFSIEFNVEDINKDKLKLLKKYKVNRLSIGVQSFNAEILKKLNRPIVDIEERVNLASKYIKNLNIDIIYGMSFSSFDIVKSDVDKALKLPIKHISLYSLIIGEHTLLNNMGIKEESDDVLLEQYSYIREKLKENGFVHYEVSNFSKPGYESRHNLVYWRNENYDALGPGSSGYNGEYRYKYTYNVSDYIKDKVLIENEFVDKNSSFEYEILLALRIKEGINIEKINRKYNIDFLHIYKDKIDKLIDSGFLSLKNNHLSCTEKGVFVEEEIFRKIIF